MGALIVIGIIVAVIALLDFAALRWGVDSRSGFGDDRSAAGSLVP